MTDLPKKGDCYCCPSCGMKIEVTADCGCEDASCVEFTCCDAELTRDSPPPATPRAKKGKA